MPSNSKIGSDEAGKSTKASIGQNTQASSASSKLVLLQKVAASTDKKDLMAKMKIPEGYINSGKKFILRGVPDQKPDSDGYIKVRVGEISTAWAKYGLYETPMFLAAKDQKEAALVNVLGEDYVLYPNEEVEGVMNKFGKENDFELYMGHNGSYTKSTSSGNGVILCYLPTGEKYGSAFAEKEQLKVGFSVRNSIDGSMGFGLDSFTYRGLCWNGMIRGRKDTTNEYKHHVGNFLEYAEHLKDHVQEVLEIGKSILSYYEQLAKIELNQKYAEIISDTRIPRKALPWEFTEPEDKKNTPPNFVRSPILKGNFKISDREGDKNFKGASIFDIFNATSANIWHGKTDIRVKSFYESELNQAVAKIRPILITTSN